MQFNESLSNVHQERLVHIRLLGTGAADPTVEFGPGLTVAHQATGVYRITFKAGLGTFIGIRGHAFAAQTTSDLKGYTLVRDTFDTTNLQLDLAVWNSSFAAADLQATQYLDVTLVFAATNAP